MDINKYALMAWITFLCIAIFFALAAMTTRYSDVEAFFTRWFYIFGGLTGIALLVWGFTGNSKPPKGA